MAPSGIEPTTLRLVARHRVQMMVKQQIISEIQLITLKCKCANIKQYSVL